MAGKKKIVMIDDEADLCLLIKGNLEELGEFEVVTTTHPEEAISLCQRENPDLLLLDIVMPKMKGTEIVRSLKRKSETNHIPIIVISGLGEIVYFRKKGSWKWLPNRSVVMSRGEMIKERNHERAAELYCVEGYISKPFTTERLLDLIRQVLRKSNLKENGKNTDFSLE